MECSYLVPDTLGLPHVERVVRYGICCWLFRPLMGSWCQVPSGLFHSHSQTWETHLPRGSNTRLFLDGDFRLRSLLRLPERQASR